MPKSQYEGSEKGISSTAYRPISAKEFEDAREAIRRLKQERLATFPTTGRLTLFARAIRKFRELRGQRFPLYAVLFYFLNRLIVRSFQTVRAHIQAQVKRIVPRRHALRPANSTALVALKMTGGFGDVVILARLLESLAREATTDDFAIDLFFINPGSVEFIFQHQARIRAVRDHSLFDPLRRRYDLSGVAHHCLTFDVDAANWPSLIRKTPRLCAVVAETERNRKDFERFIDWYPSLDGAFADVAIARGLKRHTFLHAFTGLPYQGTALDLGLPEGAPEKFGLTSRTYLTVHDGWDIGYRLVAKRPTKVYRPEHWAEVVRLLKRQLPHVPIVQLGTSTGQILDHVDVNLKGKTTLAEAAAIVGSSMVHIDTESGLVHLAACMGTKCVVLFGPTSPEYFAYEQNVNLLPRVCGNCWWSTDTWMDACPRGFAIPICLDSTRPETVASQAVALVRAGRQQPTYN